MEKALAHCKTALKFASSSLASFLLDYLLFLLCRLILGRRRRAAATAAGLSFFVGIVNHYVLRFRGRILFPADLTAWETAANVADAFDFSLDAAIRQGAVLLVAGDVYRPAAIDQLKVLGGQIGVEVYTEEGNRNPVEIAENGIKYARQKNYNVVIVDTAGRLAVDEAMMQEITAIKAAVKPSETLFVVDAMTGQDAVNTAREFNERLDFDGVVLTKLDGDTRGGAAISIRSVVNKPLKFISSGEKMDALQVFHPERMADRILGMGDVVSLVERAQEQFDEEEARKLKKKLVKNQFNFNDFISQIQQIKKMGNLKDLASMLPGMGKMLKNVDIPDDVFKQTEAIISSMTPAEREHPEIINARRRERIAKGSGTTMADVNRLMKQFDDTRKMMKAVAGGGMKMPKMPGGMMRR